jgi:hypothetical protein
MRGHGFDPSTCDQLEELAGCILSASALRDPTDHRASKLSEVLQYLERRIDGLLESCTDGETAEPELDCEPKLDPEPELESTPSRQARAPAASRAPELDCEPKLGFEPKHSNGFASAHVAEPVIARNIEPSELRAGDFEAKPATPLASATDPGDTLPAARIEVEELESEVVALEAIEVATVETRVVPIFAPEAAIPRSPPEPEVSAQYHELEAHTGDDTPAVPVVPAGAEPAPKGTVAELVISGEQLAEAPYLGAEAPYLGAEAFAGPPTMKPVSSDRLLPRSPDLRTTAAAARLFLPDLEMGSDTPGREAAWTRPAPPHASAAPAVAAPTPQPATATNLQALEADPLAGLKAMSESELIALFS